MKNIKITYVGGGSRGWAWELMKDLAMAKDISGTVNLFDIDFEAALDNEKIGNSIKNGYPDASNWSYKAIEKPCDAFKEADFVISLLGICITCCCRCWHHHLSIFKHLFN